MVGIALFNKDNYIKNLIYFNVVLSIIYIWFCDKLES